MKATITASAAAAIVPKATTALTSLAEMLVELRLRAGMSQQHVADVIGLARTSVCNMEIGRQPVTLEHLDALARHLGLEVSITISAAHPPHADQETQG